MVFFVFADNFDDVDFFKGNDFYSM